jgi:hypothetical protein
MLRDVVEEPNFTDEFDLLRDTYPQLDAIFADLSWTLSSDPHIGVPVQGYPHPYIRLFITTPIQDTPAFQVLYRYTDDQVILLAIDRA